MLNTISPKFSVLGAELVEGSKFLVQSTIVQASEIVSVCARYVSIALKATPQERCEMITSKRALVKPRQARVPTDAELEGKTKGLAARAW